MRSFFRSASLTASSIALTLALASCGGGSSDKLNNNDNQATPGASSGTTQTAEIKVDVNPENIAKGKDIYQKTCASCHGADGKGDGPAAAALNPKPADHTNGTYMDKLSDDRIYKTIKQGGAAFGKPTMPPNPQLSDDETKAVIAYVRSISNTRAK